MIYIGIDPGLSGAVGIICDNPNMLLQVTVQDTPTVLVEGEKTRRKYLVPAMANILSGFAGTNNPEGVLDRKSVV